MSVSERGESIILAEWNNQRKFISEYSRYIVCAHLVSTYFLKCVRVGFLLKKYALDGRTIPQKPTPLSLLASRRSPTRKLLSNCFAYEFLFIRIFLPYLTLPSPNLFNIHVIFSFHLTKIDLFCGNAKITCNFCRTLEYHRIQKEVVLNAVI